MFGFKLLFIFNCVTLSDGDSIHCAGRGGFSKISSEHVILSFKHFCVPFSFFYCFYRLGGAFMFWVCLSFKFWFESFQIVDWRERLAMQHMSSLFTKEASGWRMCSQVVSGIHFP